MKAITPIAFASAVVVSLCVGAYGGYWYEQSLDMHLDQHVSSYKVGQLTSPLLECGVDPNELTIGESRMLEDDVQTFVDQSKANGTISNASIYFRDLNNGPRFGINADEKFAPGSLLKLPIAISLYWLEQRKPEFLDQKINFKGFESRPADKGSYGDDSPLAPGVYSIHDLIGIMLKESSNDAAQILSDYSGTDQVAQVYKDLDIDVPTTADYRVNVKTYSSFMRVLFNATYIGQPASEELLSTLTQAIFRDGLVAGVPKGVVVAHKFGTRVIDDPIGNRQLHDCGIVYADKEPYLLCIMTQGSSVKRLEYFIAQVSKRVYEGVTAQ